MRFLCVRAPTDRAHRGAGGQLGKWMQARDVAFEGATPYKKCEECGEHRASGGAALACSRQEKHLRARAHTKTSNLSGEFALKKKWQPSFICIKSQFVQFFWSLFFLKAQRRLDVALLPWINAQKIKGGSARWKELCKVKHNQLSSFLGVFSLISFTLVSGILMQLVGFSALKCMTIVSEQTYADGIMKCHLCIRLFSIAPAYGECMTFSLRFSV